MHDRLRGPEIDPADRCNGFDRLDGVRARLDQTTCDVVTTGMVTGRRSRDLSPVLHPRILPALERSCEPSAPSFGRPGGQLVEDPKAFRGESFGHSELLAKATILSVELGDTIVSDRFGLK